MRRMNVLGGLIVVGLAVACSPGDRTPTELGPLRHDLGTRATVQSVQPTCPAPDVVLKEIVGLYPNTRPQFLRTKALLLFAAEIIAVKPPRGFKPDTAAAVKIALVLVDTTLKLYRAGSLVGGMSLSTATLTVNVLNGVLCTAGLPQSLTVDGLNPGSTSAAQVVPANAPTTTVKTGDQNAGVVIPQGNLQQTTLVTIVPLNNAPPCAPYSGPLCTPLAQFPPFYEYRFTPAVDPTKTPNVFTYEVCFDISSISVPLSQLFLAHNVTNTQTGVTSAQILPKPGAGIGLQCDNALQSSMRQAGDGRSVLELARAGDLRGAASQARSALSELFVTDAFAATGTKTTSLGGTAHSASPFGLVDVDDVIPYQNGAWAYHAPSFPAGTAPAPMTGDITNVSPAFGSASYVPTTANGWVFNTSPFGNAPFGSGTATDGNQFNCPLSQFARLNLVWPTFSPVPPSTGNLDTDPSSIFLLQSSFFLPADWPTTANLQIGVAIDNDVQVFFNGVDVTPTGSIGQGQTAHFDGHQFLIHDGCAANDSYLIPIPFSSLHTGSTPNVISVRARDRGAESYIDVQVSSTVFFAPPTPSP